MKDLREWLALLRLPATGRASRLALLEHFGGPAPLFAASAADLRHAGLAGEALDAVLAPDWAAVDADQEWLHTSGASLLTCTSSDWPPLLADMPDAPAALFVRGEPALLRHPQLAMVGSRNPTAGGRDTARDFARHLARAGLTITSGLALGIDGASHAGALEAGGTTIAVCGTGLDRIYPARHRDLAHRIEAEGALVSEFPPGTPPRRANFPQRNRIISALSLGTLVVEAARESGSLITARFALEQGREVFAIPGSIHNPLARGCHRLLREGAKLVETAQDVIEELGAMVASLRPVETDPVSHHKEETSATDDEYSDLLESVGYEPVPVDLLVERTGLKPDVISSMLLILELEGRVEATPGGRYSRKG